MCQQSVPFLLLTDVPRFINLPGNGHLVILQILAIMHEAAINTHVLASVWTRDFIVLVRCLPVEWSGHRVVVGSTFKGAAKLFSKLVLCFYISMSSGRKFQRLHILANVESVFYFWPLSWGCSDI